MTDACAMPSGAVMDDALLRVPGGLRLDYVRLRRGHGPARPRTRWSARAAKVVGVVTLATIDRVPPAERRNRRLGDRATHRRGSRRRPR
jgi:hypothetical protein